MRVTVLGDPALIAKEAKLIRQVDMTISLTDPFLAPKTFGVGAGPVRLQACLQGAFLVREKMTNKDEPEGARKVG